MMRKLALIAAVASAAALAARWRRDKGEQIDLWREATSASTGQD
ncbi:MULTISPECIES: DLW-39 family protein [Pseudofrankia]|nr:MULTISPECIES: DLW-39 family protein [Pseudofrankia]